MLQLVTPKGRRKTEVSEGELEGELTGGRGHYGRRRAGTELVMCKAGLQALKPRLPGPQKPGPAGPATGLSGLEGSA